VDQVVFAEELHGLLHGPVADFVPLLKGANRGDGTAGLKLAIPDLLPKKVGELDVNRYVRLVVDHGWIVSAQVRQSL
jgi:hypothetical protein